jgi:predicted RNase H-like nuclease
VAGAQSPPRHAVKHIGVDGCKAGWVAVTRAAARLHCEIAPHIGVIVDTFPKAERIFIDIPIGLPHASPVRSCDQLARKMLGTGRSSSVFPVPCRDALAARTLKQARTINKRRLDRSIGAQTWAICRKIAEVDHYMQSHRDWRNVIHEIHPEICFWALAGQQPMTHGKKTASGRAERLAVLKRFEPTIENFLAEVLSHTRRADVQADDVLDATAAFITAEAKHGELTRICPQPLHDERGLPMDLSYLTKCSVHVTGERVWPR